MQKATGDKYKYIAAAMGVEGTEKMSVEEYRKAAIDAVKQLSKDVGIHQRAIRSVLRHSDFVLRAAPFGLKEQPALHGQAQCSPSHATARTATAT